MLSKYKYALAAAFASAALPALWADTAPTPYPNKCYCGSLTDYKQSWIANTGGVPKTHVPHSIRSIYVQPDGRVVTVCEWDEGGTNVGIFQDNAIIAIPPGSGTGSYGRNSLYCVAADENYVYQPLHFNGRSGNDNLNSNGLRQFPQNSSDIEWQAIHRYDARTGANATFPTGYGPGANMFLVATQAGRFIQGVAVNDKNLIVSLPANPFDSESTDSLLVYDKASMSNVPLRRFRVDTTGFLYADKKGYVWCMQGKRLVPININTGAVREQSVIEFPADVDPRSFSIDTSSGRERILVANHGKDCNVLIYTNIYSKPTLTATFGETGGIFSTRGKYKRGQVGPGRLEGPTGVGVDANGNIYISNMFATGATLHAYNEATGKLLWKQEGLEFTATADFDQTMRNRVYTPERIYDIDYTKSQCRLDTLVASSVDPYNFPHDLRLEPNPPSPIKTSVFKRKIHGKDYHFVGNMYSTTLAGYRYDPEHWGYIAVPFMKIMADGVSFWYDANGDGQPADDETTWTSANRDTFSQYVDADGNIWMADRTQRGSSKARFRLWEVLPQDNALGYAQWGNEQVIDLPSWITDCSRVLYDPAADELIIGCYTRTRPWSNPSLWGQVGTTILVFDKAMEKIHGDIDPETWVAKLQIDIPFDSQTGKEETQDAKCLAFTENYIYTHIQQGGRVCLYNRHNGDYLGDVSPTAVVEYRNGWTDFTYAMNARENEDGSIEILAEENAFAKVVHYNIASLDAKMTKLGDLIPYTVQVLCADGTPFDIDNVREGDPIDFRVWVMNNARGAVTNRRASNPTRCQVRFKLTDATNGREVFTRMSQAYTRDIPGGETLLFTVDPAEEPWHYVSGQYNLEVYVNYGNLGEECDTGNNVATLSFGGKGGEAGIGDVEADGTKALEIYPNPAVSETHLSGTLTESDFSLAVYALDGATVICDDRSAGDNTLNVSGLYPGIYVLAVSGADGNHAEMKLIVK